MYYAANACLNPRYDYSKSNLKREYRISGVFFRVSQNLGKMCNIFNLRLAVILLRSKIFFKKMIHDIISA